MDSLTQIVLGAAVGEAVLGRKIGNRAMIWGGIGGTIPDLDVLANFYLTDLESIVFHRGPTHSLVFAVLMPFLLAWIVKGLYGQDVYRHRGYKLAITGVNLIILGVIAWGLVSLGGGILWSVFPILIIVFLGYRLLRYYYLGELRDVDATFTDWYRLFFWAFLTHIILDSLTAYGTQVFLPFTNTRVAMNIIAVADPAYTLPFLVMVVIAAIYNRNDPARSFVNWLGIALSSLYLVVCAVNHQRVENTFAGALTYRDIPAQRYQVSPTILNNILWNCHAETDDAYYVGLYSLYDSDPYLHVLNVLPKAKPLVDSIEHYSAYHTLDWFSDGYLHATETDTAIILTDLRFGATRDTIDSVEDFVFRFYATPAEGDLHIREDRRRPENVREEFRKFFERVMGY